NAGEAFMIYSLAENFCSSNGYTLPRANYLNHSSSRGIGSLYTAKSSSPVRQKPSRSAKLRIRHASSSRCCNR
ncbi:hypothetical protein E2K59_15980, partial [Escherichia coli]